MLNLTELVGFGAGVGGGGAHRYWRIRIEGTDADPWILLVELVMKTTTGGSNLCAGGSANLIYGGGTLSSATKVTDNLVTNNPFSTFEATDWTSTGPFTPQWYIGYDFTQSIAVTEIALAVDFFLGTSLTHLIVEASDNGTDYFQVADFPAITHGTYENLEGGGTPTWTSTTTYVMQF